VSIFVDHVPISQLGWLADSHARKAHFSVNFCGFIGLSTAPVSVQRLCSNAQRKLSLNKVIWRVSQTLVPRRVHDLSSR